ncbi:MAG: asparagine synthase (glutamine-hydrolyzing) [Alphaproteobacteria bacterium]
MCGIAGFLDHSRATSPSELRALAGRMADRLVHRGPDEGDCWIDAEAGLAIGHRRLSIIDLSAGGHQPMVSRDGRFVIAYNGEVYNFADIRAELESKGRRFRSSCDTEVLLEACAEWGVREAVGKAIGMFAFALWDRTERTLTLARDRLGIKPLYWGEVGDLFLFGSELKALTAHPGWRPEIDPNALAAFFRFAYVPSPHSIYKRIFKLPPGHIVTLRPKEVARLTRYWDLAEVAARGRAAPLDLDETEAANEIQALLRDAVKRRMIADVPLGVLLSGGIDSTTVAALMQSQSAKPVKSFTIGFETRGYDEANDARAVARYLGTEHTEFYLKPSDALEAIPELPRIYDEPFADSSQIPTLLVSRIARRSVTVALSGDGGDETFLGYNRYRSADSLWRRAGLLPLPLRRAVSSAVRAIGPAAWQAAFDLVPERLRPRHAGFRLHKAADALAAVDADALYLALVSQWQDPAQLVPGAAEPVTAASSPEIAARFPDLVERMQYRDTVTYLPDDILAKVDRASMATSLEVRVPLLDHRLAEFVWRLPIAVRRGSRPKVLLRRVLERYVPRALTDRPKAGFAVPIGQWLRGELRGWAEDLLDPAKLAADGLIEPVPVRRAFEQHLSGRRDNEHLLWCVLMFQAWRTASRAAP